MRELTPIEKLIKSKRKSTTLVICHDCGKHTKNVIRSIVPRAKKWHYTPCYSKRIQIVSTWDMLETIRAYFGSTEK